VRIEASRVGKRFDRVVALDDVSFTIPAGRRVALVGPNGSGKSTLNRVVMGLVAASGALRLDGRDPLRERVAIAQRLAYVPQIAPQLAAPVGELVGAVARVRGLPAAAVEDAVRALGLDLALLAPRPFRSLSGGTKQKLLIALAFAAPVALLVLDEPTGSLDAASRERFFALFERRADGATLLLCSHRLEEIRPLVDDVLVLNEGRLAWQGSVDRFLAECGIAQLEVWADGEAAAAWLAGEGFRRTAGGPWLRTASAAEKMRLLAAIPSALGPALRNLNARDLEAIEPSRAAAGSVDA
jgi:ABC-2 type transport system ATP-binding protein